MMLQGVGLEDFRKRKMSSLTKRDLNDLTGNAHLALISVPLFIWVQVHINGVHGGAMHSAAGLGAR